MNESPSRVTKSGSNLDTGELIIRQKSKILDKRYNNRPISKTLSIDWCSERIKFL